MKDFISRGGVASASLLLMSMFSSAAAAQAVAPIDKTANSQYFTRCVVDGLREGYLEKFREAAKTVKPGAEEAALQQIMLNAVSPEASSEITMSCISKASGVPRDQIPPVADQSLFSPFYLARFEENAGERTIDAVAAMKKDVESRGLGILRKRSP